jgi:hypothetical protein
MRFLARRWCVPALLLAALPTHADVVWLQPLASPSGTLAAPWHIAGLPHQTKPYTRFAVEQIDGRRAVRIESESAYGNLVHPLRVDGTAMTLSWQWRVDELVAESDLHDKNGDDTAVKVCVLFDLPIEQLSFVDRQALRVVRAATHEPLPAATVCYVWDRLLPAGTAIANAFTRRIRYLVLRSGAPCAIFAGDDVNDEPVFAQAPPQWLTIRVGRGAPGCRARYFVNGTHEMAQALERMVSLLGAR